MGYQITVVGVFALVAANALCVALLGLISMNASREMRVKDTLLPLIKPTFFAGLVIVLNILIVVQMGPPRTKGNTHFHSGDERKPKVVNQIREDRKSVPTQTYKELAEERERKAREKKALEKSEVEKFQEFREGFK